MPSASLDSGTRFAIRSERLPMDAAARAQLASKRDIVAIAKPKLGNRAVFTLNRDQVHGDV
jgi:hypothetical protein